MSEENEYLLKYFFLCGVPEKIKDNMKVNYFNPNNKISPILLSSYSAEGETDLFKSLQKQINNDIYLKETIFPKKATFLSDVQFPKDINEVPYVDININPFNQYIYEVSSFEQKKEHFCHCFQSYVKASENSDYSILLNFAVLIFYENVTNEKELLEEKETSWMAYLWKSKYNNIYVPKALILVSDFPIFSLMKEILEKLYIKIRKKFTFFPFEQIIINCFDKMNDKNNIQNKYKLNKEPILPYCDLNIPFFFNLFTIKELFLFAEYYLCSKNVIIASTNLEFLFPIYYILMTLFFPLNNNNETTFYKLVISNSDILGRTLFGEIPTFEFMYIEKKIDEKFLHNLCIKKDEILVYQIIKDNTNKNENVFEKIKFIYKCEKVEEKEVIKKINTDKYETIIEKICKLNLDIYDYLIPLIENDIKEIQKEEDYKRATFFRNSFDKQYQSLRNHLIGLFIKFFVTRLEPLKIEKNDENKILIKLMEFKKLENDPSANELLGNLYSTPQSDIIYKNTIIKTGQFEKEIIKKIILLDYFIKISASDKNRSYFEPKLLQVTNKKEVNKDLNSKETMIKSKNNKQEEKKVDDKNSDEKENNKNLNINELFDISKILTRDKNYYYYINRIYLYSLENPDKSYFSIAQGKYFIKHLKYYEELTKIKRTQDIENIQKYNALKYMIFYGENLELHFGQFVKRNIPNMEINYHFQNSECEYIAQNKNYEQYYKSTLDEAEIFYDLFITQIIPLENREELAACAIALYILIYLINLSSELNSKNPHNETIKNIISYNQIKLYQLLVKTKGFYGKFDFLVTLLYQLISSRQIRDSTKKFSELTMNCLTKNCIIPSILVILMNNHNIFMDFRVIKKVLEKNSRIKKNIKNKSVIFNENQKSFYNSKNYEPIKEYLITKIERMEHKHEYELLKGINDDYICKEKCGEILGFKIQLKEGDKNINEYNDFVNNPRYIIIKLLKKIVENKSFFIHSYGDIYDISQIAMLDELYFKLGFFKEKDKTVK